MQELYELKEMLVKELAEYGKKGDMSAGTLEVVDKLAHAIKNICKIIEDEEGYSGYYGDDSSRRSYRGSYRGNRGSYNDGYDGSYARGRGLNARRDSRGRDSGDGYSMHGDMISELHELMQDAPDERTKQEFQKFIQKMEQM